jgi:superfamily II DNA/RNA helicase
MDTLKNNLEYRNYLSQAWWDIIVIDECHNVAARAGDQALSRRARLAQLLSTRSDTMILLSATPHDGSARSFASLVKLLDPTAISDPDDYTREDYSGKGLVVRRFKKDIKDQVSEDFRDRKVVPLRLTASPQEEAAFEALLAIPFTQGGQRRAGKQQELQRVAMQKAIFSSPDAALDSTRNRIRLLEAKVDITTDEAKEVTALRGFEAALLEIGDANFSKYHRLLSYLQGQESGWHRHSPDDRLVIFSERLETLKFLKRRLSEDLRLKDNEVTILDGKMSDTEQQDIVEEFGQLASPLRVLLCSDVASEGLNLHYFCHRLIHFDLPWSLMIFQQRNGRVDRYGQKNQPVIVYLFTDTSVEKIKGDLRILEILQQKDEQAQKNLGDPGIFLNLYDPEKEEEVIADYMARHVTPEQVDTELERRAEEEEEGEGDWLMELFQAHPKGEPPKPADSLSHVQNPVSFFANDYEFARTALHSLSHPNPIAQWQANDEERTISITPPEDLKNRLRQLPREVQAEMYTLTADKFLMDQSIEEARQKRRKKSDSADTEEQLRSDANTWPQLHYLWPQHPILEWLGDRVLTAFGRHRAPVIQSEKLAADEQAYILMALIPNRKAQPMLVEWRVACRRGDSAFTLEDFASFCTRAGLKSRALPNPAKVDLVPLQAGVEGAVEAMRRLMVERQRVFAAEMQERLRETLRDLERLQARQLEEVTQRYAQMDLIFRQGKVEKRSVEIRRVFDDYRGWVEETMTTEPQPFIQLLAAVCH